MTIVGSYEWNHHVADLVEAVDDLTVLLGVLVDVMDALTPSSRGLSAFVICTSSDTHRSTWFYPEAIKPEGVDRDRWPPRDDPYIAALAKGRSGCLTLREVMDPGFEGSAYFEENYSNYDFCDGIVHGCEVGELNVMVGRMCQARMSDEEIEAHRAASPVIVAAARRVARQFSQAGSVSPFEVTPSVDESIERFGNRLLTPRETDVIRLILRGHNTESITNQLGISPNTVKRHRNRAYGKLHVSSQGELFSEFLGTLGMRD